MNFTLPALVVFILILPGFIARSRINWDVSESLSLDYSPFGQVAIGAVLWAAVLHLVWSLALSWLTDYQCQPWIVFGLVGSDPARQGKALAALEQQVPLVLVYLVSLVTFSYVVPAWVRRFIRKFRLDRKGAGWWSGFLRVSGAPWYYLLTGADFTEEERPDLIRISAIVSIAGCPYLYVGWLDDYFLDQEGRLDRLVLIEAMRRPLNQDKSGDEADRDRFYPIEGDSFVLRYSETTTLNVEYAKLAAAVDGADLDHGCAEVDAPLS
ncbi:hypothetical protein [Niveibacterium terrae]|uniref:hypothetical protein n=1 Tax=Niveibacterium terrae TaxID=3373598 RepID=UPI003A94A3E3